MLLLNLFIAFVGLAASSSSALAASIQPQMPNSGFNEAHTSGWAPKTIDRVSPSFASLASIASWYGIGDGFHGRRTASGEIFNAYALTAAHRTFPFGTLVRVTNLNNGRSVIVRINDRGPYYSNRSIDLSQGAASRIGMSSSGTAQVSLEVIR